MPEVAMRVEGHTFVILNGSALPMEDLQQQNVYASPRLVIEEQPASVFRFRYQSEHGSHGSLMGENSDKSKKTYPRVRIENFVGRARLRVSLYTYKEDELYDPGSPGSGTPIKHVHMLHGKGCNNDAGVCEVECDVPEEGKSIDFPNLYISHVAKRTIPSILYNRYLTEHVQDMTSLAAVGWIDNAKCTVIDEATETNLRQKAETDTKNLEKKLNSVVLCFEAEAFIQNGWVQCCEPVYSSPINNQKAAATGSLKICRIDKMAGPIKGNDDVFILCEKVDKKNIKVRFYEEDADWEDFGTFSEFDVHHQYAIVFKTPKYKDISVGEDVPVKIQLYRPSDGATSNSMNYTYTPDDDYDLRRKKRKRIECQNIFKDSQSSSCMQDPGSSFMDRKPSNLQLNVPGPSFGSGSGTSAAGQQEPNTADILDEVLNYEQQQNPYLRMGGFAGNFVANVPVTLSSNDPDPMIGQNIAGDPLADLFNEIDSSSPLYHDGISSNVMLSNYNDQSTLDFDDLVIDAAGHSPETPKPKESKIISRGPSCYDDDDLQSDGIGSVSRTRAEPPTRVKTEPPAEQPARTVPLKNGRNGKMTDNELVYRLAVHTAKKLQDYARTSDVQHLLMTMRHLAAVPDDNGDNAIHLASINSQAEAIQQLVRVADPDPINAFNELIQTPLHIAVHVNSQNIVKALLRNGADVNLLDRHGNSALHVAAKHGKAEVVRAITDKKNYPKGLPKKLPIFDTHNYNGYAPLHLAVLSKSLECVKELCSADCNINIADGTSGRTALHLAIENNCEDILRYLLSQKSLHVDCQAFNGYTPLHLACSMKLESIVKLLMTYDADPFVETCEPVNEELSSEDEANPQDAAAAKQATAEEEPVENRGCNSFDIARDHKEILEILNGVNSPPVTTTPSPTIDVKTSYDELVEAVPDPHLKRNSRPLAGDSGISIDDEGFHSESKIQAKTAYDLIDEETRLKLAEMLDGTGEKKWRKLVDIIQLPSYLNPVFESAPSPTIVVLQYTDTLDELYNGLDALGHEEALKLLQKFLTENDAEQGSPVPEMTSISQQAIAKQMSKLKI